MSSDSCIHLNLRSYRALPPHPSGNHYFGGLVLFSPRPHQRLGIRAADPSPLVTVFAFGSMVLLVLHCLTNRSFSRVTWSAATDLHNPPFIIT